mgnify:CR=1 FL=1
MAKFEATLRRGSTYTVFNTQFSYGVPKTVDEETKEYLEEHAVDIIGTSDGDTVEKPKFSFEEVQNDAAPARKRARAKASA